MPAPKRAYDLVAAAFAVFAAYVALLPLLGFRIATAAFVAVFQLLLERPATPRQWAVLAAVGDRDVGRDLHRVRELSAGASAPRRLDGLVSHA